MGKHLFLIISENLGLLTKKQVGASANSIAHQIYVSSDVTSGVERRRRCAGFLDSLKAMCIEAATAYGFSIGIGF